MSTATAILQNFSRTQYVRLAVSCKIVPRRHITFTSYCTACSAARSSVCRLRAGFSRA